MIRTVLAILVWVLMTIVIVLPVWLMGIVHPSSWIIARAGVLWSRTMLAIAGLRLSIHGAEHIRPDVPCFYMANHQSALDIPIMIAVLRGHTRFFSKRTLFYIPIFGWTLARYGFIAIDKKRTRITHRTLDTLIQRLKRRPFSIAVFPEGTRTRDGGFSPFRKGTMKIAIRAGFPVVPVAIDGSLKVNHRDDWRLRPGPVRVTVTRPIPAERVRNMTPTELRDEVVEAIARELGMINHDASRKEGERMTVATR